jgi:hypothetical protein
MKYQLAHPWPVHGGSALIPGGVIIDDSVATFLAGTVPPPDTVPLDLATRIWLVAVYGSIVPSVPSSTKQQEK